MSDEIKKMADMLRKGAKMLSQVCPDCGVPLFKIDSNIYCPSCGRKAVIIGKESEVGANEVKTILSLHDTLISKLKYLEERIKEEEETDKLIKLINAVILHLDAIAKSEEIRKKWAS